MKRIALVTGGTRGIGAAISKALNEAGYKVVATYQGNDDVAKNFSNVTGISTFKWDVSNFKACQNGTKLVTEQIGPIDVLVNNAGITRDSILHKMTEEQWIAVINTNLNSVFNMCKSVVSSMRNRSFGRIINISSVNAQKGQIGQTNYSAAKAGIIGFTKAFAQEVAKKGITVNAIAPGYIATSMTKAIEENVMQTIISQIPAGRLGTPEEVARAAVFLASDESSFITGATINLNGGQYFY